MTNKFEFILYGDFALFSDPITRVGGEKFSLPVPTYEALKGVCHSIYWKPTFTWFVDSVRVKKAIQTQSKGIRPIKMSGGNDLAYYTYLKDVAYQVVAHFEWNENRPELLGDRDLKKHTAMFERSLERGGRRDIFLGTRECQGYVEPCKFGEGAGFYDGIEEMSFGLMYHGLTYADEAYSEETRDKMSVRFSEVVMKNGVVKFARPEACIHRVIKSMKTKEFGDVG